MKNEFIAWDGNRKCFISPYEDIRKMNIYEVVSEILYKYEFMDYGPPEPYCIAHLVAAKSHSQAKYLAWKTSDDFTYNLTDMPAFSVHICEKNVDIPAGIVTEDERFQHCWR